jgi:two-component system cell cycle response regulator
MTLGRSSCTTRRSPRIVLVDPAEGPRRVLAERLRAQGFLVVERADGVEGAIAALEESPAAVVADLSMPSMSGVQLCRLLRAEGGTAHVPVVLRGSEGRRNRFWAEQAGAFSYVVKGRMGELVRALRRATEDAGASDDFFVQGPPAGLVDVRERIASHLDAALFDSVIASEVRRLGTSESFERLVDHLSQFVSQVTTYRWLALTTIDPPKLGLHTNRASFDRSLDEARLTLGIAPDVKVVGVEDEDAVDDETGGAPIVQPVFFGEEQIATIAVAPRGQVHPNEPVLVGTIARELGGAIRMAMLVEESRMLATTDALTGLMNRRAFLEWSTREALRAHRYRDALTAVLLDVDHFKQINDRRGHAAGDLVLARVADVLGSSVRSCDVVARWGGEEFVIALPSTGLAGATEVAERVRARLEGKVIDGPDGDRIPVTASFGVAELGRGETIEALVGRADEAMYRAKTGGRNRVATADEPARPEAVLSPATPIES